MAKLVVILLVAAALGTAGPVFDINNAVGIGSISGTIETDGTLGVLAAGNILNWNLLLNDGSATFHLLGPLSGSNSQLQITGTDLSANATQLTFDFSGSGYALFQNPSIGTGINYFCMETNAGCTGSPAGMSLRLTTGGNQFTAFSGTQVVATLASGGVPEPTTLSLVGVGAAFLVAFRKRIAKRS